METYSKEGLKYKDGYLMSGNKIIGVSNAIVNQLNDLELRIQKREHDEIYDNAIDLLNDVMNDKFKPKSERKSLVFYVDTPTLDELVQKGIDLADDIDSLDTAKEMNEYLKSIDKLVQFVQEDFVIDYDQVIQERFDLPTIGNPLLIDAEALPELVSRAFA